MSAGGLPPFSSSAILAMFRVWISTLIPISFSKPAARSRSPELAVTAGVMTRMVVVWAIAGVASASITAPRMNFRIRLLLLLFRVGRGVRHVHILGFGPEPCQCGDQKCRAGSDDSQRQAVIAAGMFGNGRLKRVVDRRDQVA